MPYLGNYQSLQIVLLRQPAAIDADIRSTTLSPKPRKPRTSARTLDAHVEPGTEVAWRKVPDAAGSGLARACAAQPAAQAPDHADAARIDRRTTAARRYRPGMMQQRVPISQAGASPPISPGQPARIHQARIPGEPAIWFGSAVGAKTITNGSGSGAAGCAGGIEHRRAGSDSSNARGWTYSVRRYAFCKASLFLSDMRVFTLRAGVTLKEMTVPSAAGKQQNNQRIVRPHRPLRRAPASPRVDLAPGRS